MSLPINAAAVDAFGLKYKDRLTDLAMLAESAERFQDMTRFMKAYVESKTGDGDDQKQSLSNENRNLLSVAYKNSVGSLRQAWRRLSQVLSEPVDSETGKRKDLPNCSNDLIKEYQAIVVKEVQTVCNEVIDMLKDKLIPNLAADADPEEKVFYYKMTGDYYRYLSEILEGDEKKESVKNMAKFYDDGAKAAEELRVTHPTRLGLVLNNSVAMYEVKGMPKAAIDMAKKAFDDAISNLDDLPQEEDSTKDTTLILQLLRDNVTLWQSNQDDAQEEDVGGPM